MEIFRVPAPQRAQVHRKKQSRAQQLLTSVASTAQAMQSQVPLTLQRVYAWRDSSRLQRVLCVLPVLLASSQMQTKALALHVRLGTTHWADSNAYNAQPVQCVNTQIRPRCYARLVFFASLDQLVKQSARVPVCIAEQARLQNVYAQRGLTAKPNQQ
jgi:hypothetical protein